MPPNLPKKKVYHLINKALCLKVFIRRLEGEVMNLMQKKKKKIATQFLKRTFLTLVLGMIEVPQTMQTLSSSYYTESHNKVFRGKFRCVVLEIIGSIT